VFVPNLATTTDDQLARASYAAEQGWGVSVEEVTAQSAALALTQVCDPAWAATAGDATRAAYPRNGARDAMAAVERLVEGRVHA
jgi:UDP:flavonoid glycosyltransferase YjiC (YdhE family)